METKYIQLDYGEALSAKKNILSSEINTINLMTKISRYNFHRKEEFKAKNLFKTQISSLKEKINHLQSCFPEEEIKPVIKKTDKRRTIIKPRFKNHDQELDYIKKKLSELG